MTQEADNLITEVVLLILLKVKSVALQCIGCA